MNYLSNFLLVLREMGQVLREMGQVGQVGHGISTALIINMNSIYSCYLYSCDQIIMTCFIGRVVNLKQNFCFYFQ